MTADSSSDVTALRAALAAGLPTPTSTSLPIDDPELPEHVRDHAAAAARRSTARLHALAAAANLRTA